MLFWARGSGGSGSVAGCLRMGRVLAGAFHHRWVYGIVLASWPPALAPTFYYGKALAVFLQ